jgi:hypothetical protein
MPGVGQAGCRRLLVAGLLSATLVACGRAAPVEIGMSGLPPAAPPSATTSFQGQVASVDAGAGIVLVDVRIIWTPVLTADRHERKVLVDAQTRWDPASSDLAGLKVGEEVQVEAGEAVEGVWPAMRVQLFDVD